MKPISIAPMVKVSHRHFRFLMRLMTKRCILYTPMIVARGLMRWQEGETVHAHPELLKKQLGFNPIEEPLVVQLGGSCPQELTRAGEACQEYGYKEININLGCPAETASKGSHGATLMLPGDGSHPPSHTAIASALGHLRRNLDVKVTAKCRIGVNEHDSYEFFKGFVLSLHEEGGIDKFIIHGRKALLDLSPKKNRIEAIAPLRYDYVSRLKAELPHLEIHLNGGLSSLEQIQGHMDDNYDGFMVGRLARDDPFQLTRVDPVLFGDDDVFKDMTGFEARQHILMAYGKYADEQQALKTAPLTILLGPVQNMFNQFPGKKEFNHGLYSGVKTRKVSEAIENALDWVDSKRMPM